MIPVILELETKRNNYENTTKKYFSIAHSLTSYRIISRQHLQLGPCCSPSQTALWVVKTEGREQSWASPARISLAMDKEILAAPSSSSSSSTASMSNTNLPPPEDAWFDPYQKLLPHWQSHSRSSHQVLLPLLTLTPKYHFSL